MLITLSVCFSNFKQPFSHQGVVRESGNPHTDSLDTRPIPARHLDREGLDSRKRSNSYRAVKGLVSDCSLAF